MAIRIGEYVTAGELGNTRQNSVAGWIEFAPDWGVRIELAGNLKGQLAGKTITSIQIDENSQVVTQDLSPIDREDEPDEDPYGLFDNDLDKQIRDSLADGSQNEVPKERSWDEVIPGIDPETKALYEQWDEIYGGEKDEPLATLFDPPITLPPVESLQTEEQAEPILMSLIGALAMRGIAYDLCEHCTPLMAYRIFVQEILPEANVHPGLPGTDIVQHYSAYEFCPECEAEFEADWEERQTQQEDASPPDEDSPL